MKTNVESVSLVQADRRTESTVSIKNTRIVKHASRVDEFRGVDQ